ncbi:MAG: alanine racemase, partial [Hyphomicrobiales bacterium]
MNAHPRIAQPVVGLNVPAAVGMKLEDVATPALIVDLDAFEKNVETMAAFIRQKNIRHRAHAKTHKSADIALYQIEHGGACGVCCQKVAEAEALVAGGVKDVLVSNQVVDKAKIDRLAQMAKRARVLVCVDDLGNIDDLSVAAVKHGSSIECLVEIDCGAGRCGVQWGAPVVELATSIAASQGLKFSGLQAYQGAAQHVHDFETRKSQIETATAQVAETVKMLKAKGLVCDIVGGAGTGTYYFEGTSGVYNEM